MARGYHRNVRNQSGHQQFGCDHQRGIGRRAWIVLVGGKRNQRCAERQYHYRADSEFGKLIALWGVRNSVQRNRHCRGCAESAIRVGQSLRTTRADMGQRCNPGFLPWQPGYGQRLLPKIGNHRGGAAGRRCRQLQPWRQLCGKQLGQYPYQWTLLSEWPRLATDGGLKRGLQYASDPQPYV